METSESVDLSGHTYSQLHSALNDAAIDAAANKAWVASLNGEISKRLGESVLKSLADDGRVHGTVNLFLQDGVTAKGVVDKKVDWDSAKLLAIAQTMPWDRVAAIFKITFSVPEKIYDGIKAVDDELGKRIDGARTTKPSAPKITLSKD